jgi:serine phosphatase RsbU (regulator of sigma subunit)
MFFRRRKQAREPGDAQSPPHAEGAAEGVAPELWPAARGATEAAPASTAPVGSAPPQHSTQFLTGDQLTDRRTVQVLLEAIARVSGSRDLEALLADIVDRSIEITGAERGMLLMKGASGELEMRVSRQKAGKSTAADLRFSTSVARRVLEQGQPVRATVQSETEARELGQSVYDLKLRAVMCVPLATLDSEREGGKRSTKGVLYVDSRAATRQFGQRDLGLFAALAQHISIALENARLHLDSLEKVKLEQSLSIARDIQRGLMAPIPARASGFELVSYWSAAEKASGDFFDFSRMRDGRSALVVGDVTGHGIGPALITASAQASLRSYLRLAGSPTEAVNLLNDDLCERVEDGRFLTLCLALLDERGGVEVVNAGHESPLVWRAQSGALERLPRGGPALGVIAGERYLAAPPLTLASNDTLLVFSDGLSEARAPGAPEHMYGDERVAERFARACREERDGAAAVQALVADVLAFCGGQHEDDITIVLLRRLPEGA